MPTFAVPFPASCRGALRPAGLAVAAAGVLSVVAAGAAKIGAHDAASARASATPASSSFPAPEPLRFRKISPQGAVAINAGLPISALANPAARPFFLTTSNAADRERAVGCLTSAIYYEAATEPLEGQRAVAQVVLNRVRHRAYPNSVCGVVYQGMERKSGCQFTFTCDGSLARAPMSSYWNRARQVAEAALSGSVYAPVGWATHYHTNWVVPYWSSSLVKAAVVGTHIFYRWTGGWGTDAAFRTRYAGVELDLDGLRSAATGTAVAAGQENRAHLLKLEQPAALAAGEMNAPTSGVSLHRAALRRYESGRAEGTASASGTGAGSGIRASRRWTLTRDTPLIEDRGLNEATRSERTNGG